MPFGLLSRSVAAADLGRSHVPVSRNRGSLATRSGPFARRAQDSLPPRREELEMSGVPSGSVPSRLPRPHPRAHAWLCAGRSSHRTRRTRTGWAAGVARRHRDRGRTADAGVRVRAWADGGIVRRQLLPERFFDGVDDALTRHEGRRGSLTNAIDRSAATADPPLNMDPSPGGSSPLLSSLTGNRAQVVRPRVIASARVCWSSHGFWTARPRKSPLSVTG